ncbi:MAG: alpha-galactosidase [Chitinophagaceae bacterium BSSC1]|nr:MAG: alpha-galactosidase [Chitinophagaceae bacterium BSSC1]
MCKQVITCLIWMLLVKSALLEAQPLSVKTSINKQRPVTDWLLSNQSYQAKVYPSADAKEIVLENGLVKRIFRNQGTIACISFQNLINGQEIIRAISPEATIMVNGQSLPIGGWIGQKEKAYLKQEWFSKMQADTSAFRYDSFSVSPIPVYLKWKPKSWASNKQQPSGKLLRFHYTAKHSSVQGLTVQINYALYNGIPLIVKWVEMVNRSSSSIALNKVTSELIAAVEEESAVVGATEEATIQEQALTEAQKKQLPAKGMKVPESIYIETNYAFNNAMRYPLSDQTTHWKVDTSYTSQVNYNFRTPCLLEVYPDKAYQVVLTPGQTYSSVRTHELLMDSYDRERRGLAIRKMYQTIAPWTSSNPIFMHLVSKNDAEVRNAIDQCVATGYEALILSFGSHINMEDSTASNIARWKANAAYAHSKGILIGGYSLFSSRRISDEDDVISAVTGKPGGAFFGNAPCFGSKWGLGYRDKIKLFFSQTGFDIWENDGPYPGDLCASTKHPGHKGWEDSQWEQMKIQKELYSWLNEQGVYINAPDWYFLDGTHKIAIGYREVNFSLPRENQIILNRQNIYDGTWNMSPSMGWGFVPLTKYQGGGPEAILEPLQEHLLDYKQLMIQYYGSGVQACYRGPRLYDTDSTRRMVTSVIDWYKKYRSILNSDIIHLRRPDGRDWDGILHVNPKLPQKGFMLLYNPLNEPITRSIQVPLYYTGLNSQVNVYEQGKTKQRLNLNRAYEMPLTFTIPANSYTWYVIE